MPARVQRLLAWLALAAALLLAFAPAVSRIVLSSVDASPVHAQVACHEEVSDHAPPAEPANAHHQQDSWGEDGHCAYCPLASHTPGTSSFVWAFAAFAYHASPDPDFRTARVPVSTNMRGLGSQAPPAYG